MAPKAKLNIIRDYQVIEKRVVEVPDTINAIAKCMNPKCITNFEKVTTHFRVVSKKPVALKCLYCEKITDQRETGDYLKLSAGIHPVSGISVRRDCRSSETVIRPDPELILQDGAIGEPRQMADMNGKRTLTFHMIFTSIFLSNIST